MFIYILFWNLFIYIYLLSYAFPVSWSILMNPFLSIQFRSIFLHSFLSVQLYCNFIESLTLQNLCYSIFYLSIFHLFICLRFDLSSSLLILMFSSLAPWFLSLYNYFSNLFCCLPVNGILFQYWSSLVFHYIS